MNELEEQENSMKKRIFMQILDSGGRSLGFFSGLRTFLSSQYPTAMKYCVVAIFFKTLLCIWIFDVWFICRLIYMAYMFPRV